MTKSTVYFRGPIEKVRLLYLLSITKKVDSVPITDKFKFFVKKNAAIIIIYFVGFLVALFLAYYNSFVIGLISTLIFGCLFGYDVIHHYGRYSYYELFGYPKELFIISLI